MMKYLIDTHAFLWFVSGNIELSPNARLLIENKNNEIFLSIASLWEISIKSSIGKLKINSPFFSVMDDITINQINIMSIEFKHLYKV
jgi:PIN domain nuclease of toxin-antitoxin system